MSTLLDKHWDEVSSLLMFCGLVMTMCVIIYRDR